MEIEDHCMSKDILSMDVHQIRDLIFSENTPPDTHTLCSITNRLFQIAYHDDGLLQKYRDKAKELLPMVILKASNALMGSKTTDEMLRLGRYLGAVDSSCSSAILTGVGSLLWKCSHDEEGIRLSSQESGERILNSAEAISALKLAEKFSGSRERESAEPEI